jgi:tetratricopeptide (TPR) repeat protein
MVTRMANGTHRPLARRCTEGEAMANALRRHAIAWLAGAMLVCASAQAWAAPSSSDVTSLLDQAEAIRQHDSVKFAAILAQIHAEHPAMTPGQHWRLQYNDAAQAQFLGHYDEAEKLQREIIDHSNHPGLMAKSMGMLMQNLSYRHRYEEAFTIARRAIALLPQLKDFVARHSLLSNLSQSITFAGHPDIAIKYAQMIRADLQPGESPCLSMAVEMAARYSQKTLRSDSPELGQALDVCTASGSAVMSNMIWLTRSVLMIEEQRPADALAILDRIASSVEQVGFFQGRAALYGQRANAYLALGRDAEARKAALATIALFRPGDIDNFLVDAYHVLYEVEKRGKRSALALTYYQQYADQERANLNDTTARSLAWETVQQRALIQGLETEKLSHQNTSLRLEKELTNKAMEAGRLYIALLVFLLASVGFWLYRTKRSQIRFRHLSSQDGLTGVYNHQHFMSSPRARLPRAARPGPLQGRERHVRPRCGR